MTSAQRRWTHVSAVVLSLFLIIPSCMAFATVRVSIATNGTEVNGESGYASISGDGKIIAFYSRATNIVPFDTNNQQHIYIRNMSNNITTLVSKSSIGIPGNDGSTFSRVSGDGRFVAFTSYSSNLVGADSNMYADVFVHDLWTNETTLVSIASNGTQANSRSDMSCISFDGRYVVFLSSATNLIPNDTNGVTDVFIHDQDIGETSRISVNSSGKEANGESTTGFAGSCISNNGRYVTFESRASNLVANDTNNLNDIFLHDRETHETSLISINSNGTQGVYGSFNPSISSDGQVIVFESDAPNLEPDSPDFMKDIFLHDRRTGETIEISITPNNTPADSNSYVPFISGDGNHVTYYSFASNFDPIDALQNDADIYLYNRSTGQNRCISINASGGKGNGGSYMPVLSADGSVVAYESIASNLIEGDTNTLRDIFIFLRQQFPGTIKPLPNYGIPTDPDSDLIYEDLNANGRKDFQDVVLFFEYMDWIAANEPLAAFDFNSNGRIDFNDIVRLFEEI